MQVSLPQVLLANRHLGRPATFEEYRSGGGYQALTDTVGKRTPAEVLDMLVKMAVMLGVALGLAAYMILLERKLLGRFQVRYGPNRVGPFGLLQPVADGLKMLLKEDIIPDGVDRRIFLVAPAVVAGTALFAFAVVPFGPTLTVFGHGPHPGHETPAVALAPPGRALPALRVGQSAGISPPRPLARQLPGRYGHAQSAGSRDARSAG